MAVPPPKLVELENGGGVLHQQRQWIPDQRDAFIGWLRGEFAAANAIIDSLCQHLQLIGSPGEYDFVLGSVQQRRYSWNGVLHMQQYFSVAEVVFALQQALAKKQQQRRQQMPSGGIPKNVVPVPAMQHKTFVQANNGNNSGGEGRQRRDHATASRRPQSHDRSKGRAGGSPPQPPPLPPAAAAGETNEKIEKKEDDGEVKAATLVQVSEESLSSITTTEAEPPVSSRNDDNLTLRTEDCNVNESLKEASRVSETESTDNPVEVVEDGQKADRQMCDHVFGEVKRAQLEHLATGILARTNAGDQSCIRGRLRTFLETSKRTPRSIPDVVHSMIDYLSGQSRGIFPGDVRPNYFMFHVIEEGKSLSIEEKNTSVQPLCLVSLLAEPFAVRTSRGQLTLSAGSVLKLQKNSENGIAYTVGSDPCKRILVFLGLEHASQQETSIPQKAATGSSKQTSTSAAAPKSPSWQQASRPGTGVYIPNSSSGSKCDIPISHRGACIQDVR